MKDSTGSLKAALELFKLVPDWAEQSADAVPLIAQLAAWERKTPKSDAELQAFVGVRKDAESSVTKLSELLPKETQRLFLKRLQNGEATLAEAAKLMEWLDEIGLADQLVLRIQSQQIDPPTPQVPRSTFNRPFQNRRW